MAFITSNLFDSRRKAKTGDTPPAQDSVPQSDWMNNLYSTKDEKFNVNIPDLPMGPGGLPTLPKDAFLLDTQVPWRDKQYELGGEKLLGLGTQYADALTNVENQRGARAEQIIGDAVNAANKPSMTQEQIDNEFGAGADAAGKDYLKQMDALRSYIGGAGVTGGGVAAGLAQQFELARLGQVTDTRRSLMVEKAKMDAADRVRNFNNTLVLAQQVQRSPSMIGMDWIQNVLGYRNNQLAVEKQEAAADEANKTARKAGQWQAVGSVLGGLGGLFG